MSARIFINIKSFMWHKKGFDSKIQVDGCFDLVKKNQGRVILIPIQVIFILFYFVCTNTILTQITNISTFKMIQ